MRCLAWVRPTGVGLATGDAEAPPDIAGPRAAAGRVVADSRLPTMAARIHAAGSTVEPVSGRRPVEAEGLPGRGCAGPEPHELPGGQIVLPRASVQRCRTLRYDTTAGCDAAHRHPKQPSVPVFEIDARIGNWPDRGLRPFDRHVGPFGPMPGRCRRSCRRRVSPPESTHSTGVSGRPSKPDGPTVAPYRHRVRYGPTQRLTKRPWHGPTDGGCRTTRAASRRPPDR